MCKRSVVTGACGILVAAAWMIVLNGAAPAQGSSTAEIASYTGPDRQQRLIEGGKREGVLTLYSNAPTDDNASWSAPSDWFAGLMGELGEEKGLKLFGDIAATNGLSARKGHTLLANLVAAGEAPLALTVFNYTAEQL
jgi:hypothetical protein